MRNSNRIEYIDVFRGCGIILMIMGHIGCGWYFDVFIHAFHMPMFFFLSGFFYKHTEQNEVPFVAFVKKKAKTLLIPYFVFGLLFYIIELLFMEGSIEPLLHLLWINTSGLPIAGALWFLTALFIAEIVYFMIDRHIRRNGIKWCVIILISLWGNYAGDILPFTLPYAAAAAMVGVGLFHIGHMIRKYETNGFVAAMLNMKWYIWGVCASGVIVLIFVNGYVNMRSQEYGLIPLFWFNAVLATLVGMNLARGIYRMCRNCIIGSWLKGIGENSIIYVCLNQFVLLLLNTYIIADASSMLEKIIKKGILFGGIFVILYFGVWIVMKTKLRKIIGR